MGKTLTDRENDLFEKWSPRGCSSGKASAAAT